MQKYFKYCLVVILIFFTAGCNSNNYDAMVENHKAMDLYRDGVWEVRYIKEAANSATSETVITLSIDVLKDMTEEDILTVLDYYEFTRNAAWDANQSYVGERESDYSCYAVFYKNNTNEEIRRIKYCNGKEVVPSEEDKWEFAPPELRSSDVEKGETP